MSYNKNCAAESTIDLIFILQVVSITDTFFFFFFMYPFPCVTLFPEFWFDVTEVPLMSQARIEPHRTGNNLILV